MCYIILTPTPSSSHLGRGSSPSMISTLFSILIRYAAIRKTDQDVESRQHAELAQQLA
jgi:hypothetical protein